MQWSCEIAWKKSDWRFTAYGLIFCRHRARELLHVNWKDLLLNSVELKLPTVTRAHSPDIPTYGEKALWAVYSMSPANAAYNVGYAAGLGKNPDRQVLALALGDLLERHSVLRSHFLLEKGELRRLVSEQPKIIPRIRSYQNEKELEKLLGEEYRRPFSLEEGSAVESRNFRRARSRGGNALRRPPYRRRLCLPAHFIGRTGGALRGPVSGKIQFPRQTLTTGIVTQVYWKSCWTPPPAAAWKIIG